MNDTLIDDMIENAINEILSKTARMRRARMMRTKGKMIARKRAIALRRKASPKQLRVRALKKARSIIANRILQNRKKSSLSLSAREDLEKRLRWPKDQQKGKVIFFSGEFSHFLITNVWGLKKKK